MIGDLSRATFSNIEHQGIEFVTHCIRPWLVRWEQALSRALFTVPAVYYPEHSVEGLLRGDIKSRYDAYAIGRTNGWLSANDIRSLENMNAVPNGDVYLEPMNMRPAGSDPQSGAEESTR
jgi:HK97 family phage portal protein